jgi:hypothetical protein
MNRRGFVRNSLAAAVGASLPLGSAFGAILSRLGPSTPTSTP